MSEILDFLANIPIWAWVIIVFFIIAKSGKSYKKIWDYEVNFPLSENFGFGEIDFECRQHEDIQEKIIKLKLNLKDAYLNQDVLIYLNDKLIFTYPKERNINSKGSRKFPLEHDEPSAGDVVSVRIANMEIFSGHLQRD